MQILSHLLLCIAILVIASMLVALRFDLLNAKTKTRLSELGRRKFYWQRDLLERRAEQVIGMYLTCIKSASADKLKNHCTPSFFALFESNIRMAYAPDHEGRIAKSEISHLAIIRVVDPPGERNDYYEAQTRIKYTFEKQAGGQKKNRQCTNRTNLGLQPR